MDERTLTALQGSIAKWEAIVAGTGADHGDSNCPLCQIFFYSDFNKPMCGGCPVMARTRRAGCGNSPYQDWVEYQEGRGSGFRVFDETSLALAQAELDFLRSLLPKESK